MFPNVVGASIVVSDATELQSSVDGSILTPGTRVYVIATDAFYVLKSGSGGLPVHNVTGAQWVLDTSAGVNAGTRNALGGDAATSVFASLGASDGGYVIDGTWLTGAAGDTDLLLQFNAVNSGYTTLGAFAVNAETGFRNFTWAGNFGAGANTNGFAIGRAGGNSGRSQLSFRLTVQSSPIDGVVFVESHAIATDAAGVMFEYFDCKATVALAGPVTLATLFTRDAGSLLKAGSVFRLQKQGFTA